MSTAIAVIGSNFGDEGKGLATDYLARQFTKNDRAPLVVRCNGGAQAGHTVRSGDKRHIFGHIGSGTLAGSDTYLAQNFIINPLAYVKELKALSILTKKQKTTTVYAHRECRVTTIYDMAMNSLVELMRDGRRHGSCGLGINETVTRHRAGHFLTIGHIMSQSPFEIAQTLKRIHDEWIPKRLAELGIFSDKFKPNVMKKAGLYFSMFGMNTTDLAVEMREALSTIRLEDPKIFNDHSQNIIIEGAQGVMLDEFLGTFPHVTRSVTGLSSHVQAAHECGYTSVQPIYVTRAYLTRHGNGDLHNEGEVISSASLVDDTNVDNEWQGKLRYAPLDVDALKQFVLLDHQRGQVTAQLTSSEIGNAILFITCMDQLGENVQISINGQLEIIPAADLISTVSKHLGIQVALTSRGPEAKDVKIEPIGL